MARIDKKELITLYRSDEIAEEWRAKQSSPVIKHPKHGRISPNQYRAMYKENLVPIVVEK